MLQKQLPKCIDPHQLAARAVSLEGTWPLSGMARLGGLIELQAGHVEVKIECGRDKRDFNYLKMFLSTNVNVQCQRCLHRFDLSIEAQSNLSPITNDKQANELPAVYEPLLLAEDGTVLLAVLIEDELILNLPIIPMHPLEICESNFSGEVMVSSDTKSVECKNNPFSLLQQLKG